MLFSVQTPAAGGTAFAQFAAAWCYDGNGYILNDTGTSLDVRIGASGSVITLASGATLQIKLVFSMAELYVRRTDQSTTQVTVEAQVGTGSAGGGGSTADMAVIAAASTASHNADPAAHGLTTRARSQVVLIGDSHTQANQVLDSTSPAYTGWNSRSPWFWVNARLGGGVSIEPQNVLGLGGQNSATIAAAVPAHLAANPTAHVAVICVGGNDIGSLTKAQTLANTELVVQACLAARILPVVCPPPPGIPAQGTPRRDAHRDLVAALRTKYQRRGDVIWCNWGATVVGDDGYLQAAYSTSESAGCATDVHLGNRGAVVVSGVLAAVIGPLLDKPDPFAQIDGTIGGDESRITGARYLPTNVPTTTGADIVRSHVARTDGLAAQWLQVVSTESASLYGTNISPVVNRVFAAGDIVELLVELKVTEQTGLSYIRPNLLVRNATPTTIKTVYVPWYTPAATRDAVGDLLVGVPLVLRSQRYTLPADSVALLCSITTQHLVAGNTSTVLFGRVTLRKL